MTNKNITLLKEAAEKKVLINRQLYRISFRDKDGIIKILEFQVRDGINPDQAFINASYTIGRACGFEGLPETIDLSPVQFITNDK